MDKLDALRALLAKVEAKRAKHTPFIWFQEEVKFLGLSLSLVARAYGGSMDAANSLHGILLPSGWTWSTADDSHNERWFVVGDGVEYETDECYSDIPARGWLIAILKALISQQERGEE